MDMDIPEKHDAEWLFYRIFINYRIFYFYF